MGRNALQVEKWWPMRNKGFQLVSRSAFVVAAWLGSAIEADAVFVTEYFGGTVTAGTSPDFGSFPGSAILGSFSYDSNTVASAGATATSARYATGSLAISVPAMNFSYQAAAGTITIVHMPGVLDSFILEVPDGFGEDAFFSINDPTGSSLSSTALPSAPNFGASSTSTLHYSSHHAFSTFDANITSFAPVPEPSSLILVGLGGAATGIGMARRRRRGSRTIR